MVTDSAALSSQLTTSHPHERAAGSRIVQQFMLFTGVGYVFFLLVTAPSIVQAARVMAPWWTVAALVLVYGTGITCGVMAFRKVDSRRLRVAASTSAGGFALAVALWPLGWSGTHLDTTVFWIQALVGLPSLTAAAAWRPVWPFVYMAVTVAAVSAINHQVRTVDYDDPLLVDAAWTMAFCLGPVAASVMGIRSARLLDSTRESMFATAGDAAAVQARTVERTRLDALTHDGVMTTLLTAARQGRTPAVARQARDTLAEMRDLADGTAESSYISATSALGRVRHALVDADPLIASRTSVDDSAQHAHFPIDAVGTVAAAAAEALRNSRRHAGTDAHRSVVMSVSENAIEVVVTDDGLGFDLHAVPAHRLGLAVSIRGRLDSLPGGTATIDSALGAGTTVVIRWSRP